MTAQRVVITAGASGIGRAYASAFAATGAKIAICDINADAVAAFASEFPDAIAAVADVTDKAQMDAFLANVDDRFDGVDLAIANAGTGGPAGHIEDLELTDWQACISANLDGAFQLCAWAARHMKTQKSGSMILMSSTGGMFGYPLRSPYCTAKWGVIGLMKALACELGPFGIRVNAICPGAVEGDRMERVLAMESAASGRSTDETRELYVKGVSMKTWVTTDDLIDAAMFLSSPAASKISGLVLPVDGHTETINP